MLARIEVGLTFMHLRDSAITIPFRLKQPTLTAEWFVYQGSQGGFIFLWRGRAFGWQFFYRRSFFFSCRFFSRRPAGLFFFFKTDAFIYYTLRRIIFAVIF